MLENRPVTQTHKGVSLRWSRVAQLEDQMGDAYSPPLLLRPDMKTGREGGRDHASIPDSGLSYITYYHIQEIQTDLHGQQGSASSIHLQQLSFVHMSAFICAIYFTLYWPFPFL